MKKVYILLRANGHASPTIDGVFSTEKKAEKEVDNLCEQFGVSKEDYKSGNTEYYWEISEEEVQ